MKGYRVIGRSAHIGADTVVALSRSQYSDRRHLVEIRKEDKKSGAVIVRAIQPLAFKQDEEIGLVDVPRYLEGVIESIDAPVATPVPDGKVSA